MCVKLAQTKALWDGQLRGFCNLNSSKIETFMARRSSFCTWAAFLHYLAYRRTLWTPDGMQNIWGHVTTVIVSSFYIDYACTLFEVRTITATVILTVQALSSQSSKGMSAREFGYFCVFLLIKESATRDRTGWQHKFSERIFSKIFSKLAMFWRGLRSQELWSGCLSHYIHDVPAAKCMV